MSNTHSRVSGEYWNFRYFLCILYRVPEPSPSLYTLYFLHKFYAEKIKPTVEGFTSCVDIAISTDFLPWTTNLEVMCKTQNLNQQHLRV